MNAKDARETERKQNFSLSDVLAILLAGTVFTIMLTLMEIYTKFMEKQADARDRLEAVTDVP